MPSPSLSNGEQTPVNLTTTITSLATVKNATVAVPRSARNGYNGDLSDGTAAHCMGMAFGDGSMSCFPDTSLLSLTGFSDSQSGFGVRKPSFRTAASAATANSGAYRGPSPSTSVTVASTGYVFINDSASRFGANSDSNSVFFGADNSNGSVGNGNDSGHGDFGNAPALKRVKSSNSSTTLLGIASTYGNENMLKRQSSTGSLIGMNNSKHNSKSISTGRKSVMETISGIGKSQGNSKSKIGKTK